MEMGQVGEWKSSVESRISFRILQSAKKIDEFVFAFAPSSVSLRSVFFFFLFFFSFFSHSPSVRSTFFFLPLARGLGGGQGEKKRERKRTFPRLVIKNKRKRNRYNWRRDGDFSRTRPPFPTGERNCIRKRKRQRSQGALFSLKSKALFHPSCFSLYSPFPFHFRVLRLAFHYPSTTPPPVFCSFSRGRDALPWLVFKIISEWNSRTVTFPLENLLPRFTASDLSRPCFTSSGGTRGRHPPRYLRVHVSSNPISHPQRLDSRF